VELAEAYLNCKRRFPAGVGGKLMLLLSGLLVVSGSSGSVSDTRTLKFYHTHTGQTLEASYFRDGRYNPDALQALRAFLADWRTSEQQDIDPQLLDILWQIQQSVDNHGTYEVISAYRSPETNEMLRRSTSGVAESSQHVNGNAIDVRLQGLDTALLRDAAKALNLGGVGYYSASDFVHIDSGRPRYW